MQKLSTEHHELLKLQKISVNPHDEFSKRGIKDKFARFTVVHFHSLAHTYIEHALFWLIESPLLIQFCFYAGYIKTGQQSLDIVISFSYFIEKSVLRFLKHTQIKKKIFKNIFKGKKKLFFGLYTKIKLNKKF